MRADRTLPVKSPPEYARIHDSTRSCAECGNDARERNEARHLELVAPLGRERHRGGVFRARLRFGRDIAKRCRRCAVPADRIPGCEDVARVGAAV